VLPLDDPRWRELSHRNWRKGSPVGDSDAPFVPDVLAKLYETPEDPGALAALAYLCSEGTTYAAAYAAIPHLVQIASTLEWIASGLFRRAPMIADGEYDEDGESESPD
jgi:hypothetical protein